MGVDVVRVEGLTQEQLAGEGAPRALRHDDLVSLAHGAAALRLQGEHVLLHRELDRLGIDAGDVELDDEAVSTPVGVDWHARRPASAVPTPDLFGQTIQVPERIGAHQHRGLLSSDH